MLNGAPMTSEKGLTLLANKNCVLDCAGDRECPVPCVPGEKVLNYDPESRN